MTAISPTEGVGGAELTITGTGFGANNADNKVAIGMITWVAYHSKRA